MRDMWWVDRHGRLHEREGVLHRLVLDGAPKNRLRRLMQNLGLVLLVFSFVCFTIACFSAAAPHWNKLVAAGLAFLVAAEIFGGIAALHYLSR